MRDIGCPAVLPLLVGAVLAACGGGGGGGGDAPGGAGSGAEYVRPRPYALASTGVQAAPGAISFFATGPANLAQDADVVAVHQDFYGVPWDAFTIGDTPPPEWAAQMVQLRDPYAGRRIFLSLQLAGGAQRAYLADRARVVNGISVSEAWGPRCYDFATAADGAARRAAWARYVAWMVATFDPEWVNVGVELNLFAVSCPAAWPGMVATERAGYQAAKAAKPSVIAFPSVQLDVLYGRQQCAAGLGACYDANFAALAGLAGDRFAVSAYPQGDPVWRHPADIPSDYLTRAADRAAASPAGTFGSGAGLAVAETGWCSATWRATLSGTCLTDRSFTEADTDAWLAAVLYAAQRRSADLVTWWSNRDFLPAAVSWSCTYDATWAPVVSALRASAGSTPTAQYGGELGLKAFGTMGIRAADGTAKSAPYQRWKAAQARPIQRQ